MPPYRTKPSITVYMKLQFSYCLMEFNYHPLYPGHKKTGCENASNKCIRIHFTLIEAAYTFLSQLGHAAELKRCRQRYYGGKPVFVVCGSMLPVPPALLLYQDRINVNKWITVLFLLPLFNGLISSAEKRATLE
ncbi:hypothetical protein WA026_000903 [Henosepilachna vigintioctopunctata]|uniref:Uncharacterized protein n=1 Tax=Henosepilachna vigintioctopunctata TaxID=420089 RepID=A0AAW1V9V5_9CUCU